MAKKNKDRQDDKDKIQAQLAEENAMLRGALDTISDAFIVFDPEDRVLAFNAKLKDFFPSLHDALEIGATHHDLILAQTERDQIKATQGGEKDWITESVERHRRADGTEVDLEFTTGKTLRHSEHRSSSGGVFALYREVTELKAVHNRLLESEIRFRAIADGLPIPLIITARNNGRILYANSQVENILGVDNARIVGMNLSEFFDDPSVGIEHVSMLETQRYIDHSFIDMRHVNGRRIPTMHSLRSIKFDGAPAIVGTFMDISEQRHIERDLRRAKEEAEAANASKTQFLAVMSHELRTPLNAIIGFSELMRQQVFGALGNERYRGYADDIHKSGGHLLSLISDILDLSRIEAGHLEREETEFDLRETVEECITYLQGRATVNNIAIVSHIPEPCPNLLADERQTKQILLNLLTNAVKFTADSSAVHVYVGVEQNEDLQLRVIDQGDGIPADELDHILEPFTRLEGPHTSRVEGTGLGLAIVKGLFEGHGGRLQLNSRKGRGTEAIVVFPAARVRSPA